jgi:hypothetical protein
MQTLKQKSALAAQLRHALIGKIKKRAQLAGLPEGSAAYRDWLAGIAEGKRSCGEMTLDELSAVCDRLEGKTPRGVDLWPEPSPHLQGAQIPTPKQWRLLGDLARKAGWTGLADPKLIDHCRRTAKIEELADLDRRALSDCIAGLERRIGQIRGKARRAVAKVAKDAGV